jgi:hypothetical protein
MRDDISPITHDDDLMDLGAASEETHGSSGPLFENPTMPNSMPV